MYLKRLLWYANAEQADSVKYSTKHTNRPQLFCPSHLSNVRFKQVGRT